MTSTPKPKTSGQKPDYAVIGHNLYAQSDEGEIVLDLRIPIKTLETFMTLEDKLKSDEIADKDMPRWLLDNVCSDEDRATLEGMKDGAKAYAILMRYSAEVGKRLGAGLGESVGSTDSSESTEQPSEPTSDTGTE
jgi:hypothetical protein